MSAEDPTNCGPNANIPTGPRLLYRTVGMKDYALCDVLNVTTSGLELLMDRAWEAGTVMIVLVRPEGKPGKYYRLNGAVDRKERAGNRWLHVVRASSSRPWSPMVIYDLMYQALTESTLRAASVSTHLGNTKAPGPDRDSNTGDTSQTGGLARGTERPHVADDEIDAPFDVESANDGSSPDQGNSVVYSALAWFAPFSELNELLRKFIAREQIVTKKPAGTTLLERGSQEDTAVYLVDGTLELEAFDGKKISIMAGTRSARLPVSLLRPNAYTVKAVTDVTVILVSQELVRRVARIIASQKNRRGMIEVSEQESLPPERSGA